MPDTGHAHHPDGTAPADDSVTEVGVRIKAHPALCNAWGNCARFAPDVYFLDDEGYIAIDRMEVPPELALQAWIGATSCPEGAITVIGKPESYWRERQKPPAAASEDDRTPR